MKSRFPLALIAAAACAMPATAANVNVVLTASAAPGPLGTYNPGDIVTITVALRHSTTTALSAMRFAQIDYSASTPGVVNVDSDIVDFGFPAGTITNTAGSNLLTWDSGIAGALTIPGSAATPIVFCTFTVTMPATPGTGVLVSVLGPALDDGSATGAHFESDTAGVWANGDGDATNNVGLGTIGLMTTPVIDRAYQTIYSAIATSNSSLVPAGANVTLPAGTRFSAFDRPYRSPDGSKWVMSADTDNATTTADEVIMSGEGLLGTAKVQEGWGPSIATFLEAGHTLGNIIERMGINNSGHFTFHNDALGTPTTNDLYVIKYDGTNLVEVAQEGSTYAAIPKGGTVGATVGSAMINNAGDSGFFTIAGVLTAATNDVGVMGSNLLFRQGFIPTGQSGTPAAPDTFSSTLLYTGDAGGWLVQCSLPGTTNDDMIVRNAAVPTDPPVVLVQEGSIVPGSSFTSPVNATAPSYTAFMESNGDVFITGRNADGEDWVMRNGVILVTTDDTITPSDTEIFDDTLFANCFFWMRGNNVGDYVIGGTTNFPETDYDAVLVLNGTTVVARQGDPVDLNRNGVIDDNAYIGTFNDFDGYLTDNKLLYFTAILIDGAGTALDQAFIRIDLTPCVADLNYDDQVNVTDLLGVIAGWGACPANGSLVCPDNPCDADTNHDCQVNVTDLLAVIGNWGGCP